MNRDWLRTKLNTTNIVELARYEIQDMGLNERDEKNLLENIEKRSRNDKRWNEFMGKMQPNDELWHFKSPAESWNKLAGRAGYAIVRDGEIVAHYITRIS